MVRDPLRESTDPNRRCTCGYRRFREQRIVSESDVERWMEYVLGVSAGMGAAPLGDVFGADEVADWGLFTATKTSVTLNVICENCARVRSSTAIGGAALFGSYVDDGYFYVVGSSVSRPITCYRLKMVGQGLSVELPLFLFSGSISSASTSLTPSETAEAPPPGAELVDTLLRARLPDIETTGNYTFTLVDRCAGTETTITTTRLEAPPMIITPEQAELGGFPELWLRQNAVLPTQPASGSAKGIPLPYCEAVLEYDARFGTDPATQGWTHQAGGGTGVPGNYSLTSGGVLKADTPGSTNPSYWEDDAPLGGAPTIVHGYASFLWEAEVSALNPGEGLDFQALYAADAAAFAGARWTYHGEDLYLTELDASGEVLWPGGEHDPNGWHRVASSVDASRNQTILNDVIDIDSTFGTVGVAAAHEIRARFGDVIGEGVTAYIRNFVVSTPGRFVRPWFRAVAPTTTAALRLHLIADSYVGTDRTARFKVRYGPEVAGPYATPVNEVDATVNFAVSNTMYTVQLDLAGLTANAPFWFTVERDWGHADDLLPSTAWLLHSTVRAA